MKKLIILNLSILLLLACASPDTKKSGKNVFIAERILPQISADVGEKLIYEGKFIDDNYDFDFHFIIKFIDESNQRVVAINQYGTKVLDGNFTDGSFALEYISPDYKSFVADRFKMIATFLIFPPQEIGSKYYSQKNFIEKYKVQDGYVYYYYKKYDSSPFKMQYTQKTRVKGNMFFKKYENDRPTEMVYEDAIYEKLKLEFKLTEL